MTRQTLLITASLLVVLLAGCTDPGETEDPDDGTNNDPTDPGTNNTTLEPVTQEVSLGGAYPATIAYEPATIEVPADSLVTVRFTNDDLNPIPPHDWVLEGHEDEASTAVIDNGETDEVTFEAPPPGEYAFYCSVPGHRDNGMEGTFTVA